MGGGQSLSVKFISWWYRDLAALFWANFKYLFLYIHDYFSVSICLKTLFDVWKRDMINYEGLSLQQILEAWVLNLSSRLVGFTVKFSVLIVYVIFAVLYLVGSIFVFLVWVAFPVWVTLCVLYGLKILLGA